MYNTSGSYCLIRSQRLVAWGHHTSPHVVMDQDEEYTIPLTDQRVFGAGITKRRMKFVPPEPAAPQTAASIPNGSAIADLYRSIVLKEDGSRKNHKETNECDVPDLSSDSANSKAQLHGAICEICNLPLESSKPTVTTPANPHEASIVHQVCLSHSHPPSNLDRTRKGLVYLSSYGWDPDSRLGLGATGHGRLAPVRGKVKNDTLGVGFEKTLRKSGRGIVRVEKEMEKLDAKGVRKLEAEGKRKRGRLQEMFYGSDEIERYLEPGG